MPPSGPQPMNPDLKSIPEGTQSPLQPTTMSCSSRIRYTCRPQTPRQQPNVDDSGDGGHLPLVLKLTCASGADAEARGKPGCETLSSARQGGSDGTRACGLRRDRVVMPYLVPYT